MDEVAEGELMIRLGLGVDGVQPFKRTSQRSSHTYWPVVLTNCSLPPWVRNRPGAMMLVGLIPGPSVTQIASFLEPIVDELHHNYVQPWEIDGGLLVLPYHE